MNIPILIDDKWHISKDNKNEGVTPPGMFADYQRTVFVLYTSASWTLLAMEKAHELANPFGDTITVLVIQAVPYALPLEYPPVPMEFITKHFSELSRKFSEAIRIRAYLCRNRVETLKRILNLNTPIVIATRKKWWPTSDSRLARKLSRAGYMVIRVETD